MRCPPRSAQHASTRYVVKTFVITARQIMHTAKKRRWGFGRRIGIGKNAEREREGRIYNSTTCDKNAPERRPSAAIIYGLRRVGWESMNSRSLAEETLRQTCSGRSNVIFMGENIKRSCPGCRKNGPFGGKAHGARSVYF